MKNKIEAKIIADSVSHAGYRLTTMVIKFPRYILAELNTHRAISKNSASSRAKPFKTMLKSIKEDPFIPVAWMKDHSGMQGSDFFLDNEFLPKGFSDFGHYDYNTCKDALETQWLKARDFAVDQASRLAHIGLTKQIVNRILEPYLWHEVVVTATDWENFFGLRCPQYEVNDIPDRTGVFSSCIVRSRKEAIEIRPELAELSDIEWRKRNTGMADIHIMDLAEAMYDAYTESEPELLEDGNWHLPYTKDITGDSEAFDDFIETLYVNGLISKKDYENVDHINDDELILPYLLKVSAARCARISYKTFGDDSKKDVIADIKLHDNLLVSQPIHASPAEHQGRAMSEIEIGDNYTYLEGEIILGVSRNFRGFKQYRTFLANETII